MDQDTQLVRELIVPSSFMTKFYFIVSLENLVFLGFLFRAYVVASTATSRTSFLYHELTARRHPSGRLSHILSRFPLPHLCTGLQYPCFSSSSQKRYRAHGLPDHPHLVRFPAQFISLIVEPASGLPRPRGGNLRTRIPNRLPRRGGIHDNPIFKSHYTSRSSNSPYHEN